MPNSLAAILHDAASLMLREPAQGVPRGSSLGGSLSLPGKSSENLEEVPRIWEGEGYWRPEITNPMNNDHWVSQETLITVLTFVL